MGSRFWRTAVAAFIIAVGVVLLLNALGVNVDVGDILLGILAIFVILVGLALLRRSRRPMRAAFEDRFAGEMRVATPDTLADATYQVTFGELVLDLTKSHAPDGERTIVAGVVVGRLKVIVPKDLALNVDAEVTVGSVRVFDRESGGLFRVVTYTTPGYSDADQKVGLDVEVTVGELVVKRSD
ncbi:MAG: hypothetical protein FJ315_03105 [SAR202 cluster bacterium]|nr:hypothetical protein [SAR202 cluster bacterium]